MTDSTATGGTILAKALQRSGIDTFFFIMGAPMLQAEAEAIRLGLRGIDVRHEQAGVMAAHAYARLRGKPAACMAASGPGTTNMVTGVAHAWADCVPVLVLGGSSPTDQSGKGVFQELDQVTMMEPCTKWAERVHQAARIPELVDRALRICVSGKPGPVYLDFPADVLTAPVDESKIVWPSPFNAFERPRPAVSSHDLSRISSAIASAKRPIIIFGGGALWADAGDVLTKFIDKTEIPFFTTPQARGLVPDDHPLCFLSARATAFREADLVLVLGTRMNYMSGHVSPPRFRPDVRVVRIDVDAQEIADSPNLEVGACADLKVALEQLLGVIKDRPNAAAIKEWNDHLRSVNETKSAAQEKALSNPDTPIHPLRLCREVRDFLDRDAVLVVDGQEILNFGRQAIPSYRPGHRLNSGTFGTMGVGMPFGVGAKVARPEAQVVVLHGDGSFGLNAMEFDTAVRHKLPLIVVVSLNGGWTGDPERERPGRELGYTRFDRMAEALGGHGEWVESPEEIRPALERAKAAVAAGKPALVNVVTDWRARATTVAFTRYVT
ncbi:thiamine pyrophosphate-binding protein [Bradyrhizobium sp. 1]|uniref:thiamine pyrophosphate-binding protein n=1 Tax=Bradyrhizobium sp. 1 TaxID=241591 RepID=UPI001FF7D029|nr:thiamine pyrophosphate-binding protein [Bradyrhizobium sp. 1]MCK1394428.1 thiamine pyrophosphate-binding protein [Bradyrhizobium sp. 1]